MSQIHGNVGLQSLASGAPGAAGLDLLGGVLISQAAARYMAMVRAGKVFTAHNVAAQAVSVALATTYTGLCVSNPNGNDKDFVMLGAGYALSVAPAAIASLHILTGFSASADVVHTTPLAAPGIQNARVGAAPASSARADSAATISTPTYRMPMMGGFTAAALPSSPLVWLDLAGLLIVEPGGFIAAGALTAVTGLAAFAWAEIDRV